MGRFCKWRMTVPADAIFRFLWQTFACKHARYYPRMQSHRVQMIFFINSQALTCCLFCLIGTHCTFFARPYLLRTSRTSRTYSPTDIARTSTTLARVCLLACAFTHSYLSRTDILPARNHSFLSRAVTSPARIFFARRIRAPPYA